MIVSGLKESQNENAIGRVLNFFKDEMGIRIERNEIKAAFRFGTTNKNYPRQIGYVGNCIGGQDIYEHQSAKW